MVSSTSKEDAIEGMVLDIEGIAGNHSIMVEPARPVTRVAGPLSALALVTQEINRVLTILESPHWG